MQGGYKEMSFILADNNAIVYEFYEPKCGGRGRVAGSQPMSSAVQKGPKKTLGIKLHI